MASNKRQKLVRVLFFVGIALLIAALAGTVLIATRSYHRRTLEDSIRGEDLVPPTMTPTPALTPTLTPTLTTPPHQSGTGMGF